VDAALYLSGRGLTLCPKACPEILGIFRYPCKHIPDQCLKTDHGNVIS